MMTKTTATTDQNCEKQSSDSSSKCSAAATSAREAYNPATVNAPDESTESNATSLPAVNLVEGTAGGVSTGAGSEAVFASPMVTGASPESLLPGVYHSASASGATPESLVAESTGTGTAGPGGASGDAQLANQNLPPEVQQLFNSLDTQVSQLNTEVSLLTQVVQLDQEVNQLSTEVGQLQSELGQTQALPPAVSESGTATSPSESTASTATANSPTESTSSPATATSPTESTSSPAILPNAGSDLTGTNTASGAPGTAPTDATIQLQQTTDPQAASILQSLEPATSGISQAGFSQFESTFAGAITSGQYPDEASAASQAFTQLQNSDLTDATIAQPIITNNFATDGDAAVSYYQSNGSTGTGGDNSAAGTAGTTTSGDSPPGTASATVTGTDSTTGTTSSPTAENTSPSSQKQLSATTATGEYSVVNGQIIGPNGQPFIAKGINLNENGAATYANQIQQDLPDLNMVRLNASTSESPQEVQNAINTFTSLGDVVEVEDHSSDASNTNNVLTGSALTNEENWYSQIAAANVDNPNVWFGTANEPTGDAQDVVNQEVGIYNAIRSTGNNNMIELEMGSGSYIQPMQKDASAYSNMTNVAWDAHFYGWESNGNDQSTVDSSLQALVQEAQSVQTGEGVTPVVIGEYGNSGTGYSLDSNGSQVVTAVQSSGLGSTAWQWSQTPDTQDSIIDTSGNLTSYGQEIAQYINGSNTNV